MKPFALLAGLPLVLLCPLPGAAEDKREALKPIHLTLNTDADEDNPHVASDGLKLYFASRQKDKWEILVSRRRSTRQLWPLGKVYGPYVQTTGDDRGVSLSPERRYPQVLFFATTKDKEQDNLDIYVAVDQGLARDSVFAAPTSVDEVNTRADEANPWLTGDGRHLFFDRKTKDGWETYLVSRPRERARTTRGFGEARRFEALPTGYHHVTVSPDGGTVYCQGPVGKGRTGLYRIVRDGDGWTKPEALDALNHPEGPTGDRSPCLSRDGRLLYFVSDRPGGKGGTDVWVIGTAMLK